MNSQHNLQPSRFTLLYHMNDFATAHVLGNHIVNGSQNKPCNILCALRYSPTSVVKLTHLEQFVWNTCSLPLSSPFYLNRLDRQPSRVVKYLHAVSPVEMFWQCFCETREVPFHLMTMHGSLEPGPRLISH